MSGARTALIVASYEYDDPGLRRLRAPARDAEELASVLRDPEIGGFDVRTVLNEPAHVVTVAVEEFFTGRSTDDLLLLHFSGHGVKDETGDLYFAASNTRLGLLGSTAVPADFVNHRMNRTRSRRVVLLLDCCYAGAFEHGMTKSAGTTLDLEERLGGRGRAVITASTAMEYAFEGKQLTDTADAEPSVFTSALVEGLRTGDADRDLDGMIDLDELYEYIYDKVRETTPNQTPSKWAFGFQGELNIARRHRLPETAATLPEELQAALDSPLAGVRGGVIQELQRCLTGRHVGMALAARQALSRLADDDSKSVAAAAAAALAAAPEPTLPAAWSTEPDTAVEAQPEAPVDEKPEVPVEEQTEVPVEEQTEATTEEQPVETVEQEPVGTTVEEEPVSTKVEEEPATTVEHEPEAELETAPPEPPETTTEPVIEEPEDTEPTPPPPPRRWLLVGLASAAAVAAVVAGAVWLIGDNGGGGGGGNGGETTGSQGIQPLADDVVVAPARIDDTTKLFTINAETRVSSEFIEGGLPSISPDRTLVTFLKSQAPGKPPEPWIAGADGSDPHRFIQSGDCRYSTRPAWSESGQLLALVCLDASNTEKPDIYIYDSDGTLDRKLQTPGRPLGGPTWIGDIGIFYMSTKADGSGPSTIWLFDTLDANPTQVTTGDGGSDSHVDWSKERNMMLFLRTDGPDDSLGDIWTMDASGSQNAWSSGGTFTAPTWSPDGNGLAFLTKSEDGSQTLEVANFDDPNGDAWRSLPTDGGVPGPPAWGTR